MGATVGAGVGSGVGDLDGAYVGVCADAIKAQQAIVKVLIVQRNENEKLDV